MMTRQFQRACAERLAEFVQEAYHKAIAEGIQANTIIINKDLVKTPQSPIPFSDGRGPNALPEMICGLNIWTVNENPDNYTFALVRGPSENSRLAEFESIGMEPEELRKAAEIYRKIKEVEECLDSM